MCGTGTPVRLPGCDCAAADQCSSEYQDGKLLHVWAPVEMISAPGRQDAPLTMVRSQGCTVHYCAAMAAQLSAHRRQMSAQRFISAMPMGWPGRSMGTTAPATGNGRRRRRGATGHGRRNAWDLRTRRKNTGAKAPASNSVGQGARSGGCSNAVAGAGPIARSGRRRAQRPCWQAVQ